MSVSHPELTSLAGTGITSLAGLAMIARVFI